MIFGRANASWWCNYGPAGSNYGWCISEWWWKCIYIYCAFLASIYIYMFTSKLGKCILCWKWEIVKENYMYDPQFMSHVPSTIMSNYTIYRWARKILFGASFSPIFICRIIIKYSFPKRRLYTIGKFEYIYTHHDRHARRIYEFPMLANWTLRACSTFSFKLNARI